MLTLMVTIQPGQTLHHNYEVSKSPLNHATINLPMARIFITGSSDGLGALAANALSKRGHTVYIHARNSQRAGDAKAACPDAEDCLVADLSSVEETKNLATQLNRLGPFDAIVHNAGLMRVGDLKGKEGLPALFAVNTLAPYILTCLTDRPKRLVYLSSQLHNSGDPSLRNLQNASYGDSKLHNIMFAKGFARKFPDVECNSIDPGWVKTKMGGSAASDDIDAAVDTYVGLAEGEGWAKGQTGKHWYQCRERSFKSGAGDEQTQERLFTELEKIGGVQIPAT